MRGVLYINYSTFGSPRREHGHLVIAPRYLDIGGGAMSLFIILPLKNRVERKVVERLIGHTLNHYIPLGKGFSLIRIYADHFTFQHIAVRMLHFLLQLP